MPLCGRPGMAFGIQKPFKGGNPSIKSKHRIAGRFLMTDRERPAETDRLSFACHQQFDLLEIACYTKTKF